MIINSVQKSLSHITSYFTNILENCFILNILFNANVFYLMPAIYTIQHRGKFWWIYSCQIIGEENFNECKTAYSITWAFTRKILTNLLTFPLQKFTLYGMACLFKIGEGNFDAEMIVSRKCSFILHSFCALLLYRCTMVVLNATKYKTIYCTLFPIYSHCLPAAMGYYYPEEVGHVNVRCTNLYFKKILLKL